jgi:hypothetical protein
MKWCSQGSLAMSLTPWCLGPLATRVVNQINFLFFFFLFLFLNLLTFWRTQIQVVCYATDSWLRQLLLWITYYPNLRILLTLLPTYQCTSLKRSKVISFLAQNFQGLCILPGESQVPLLPTGLVQYATSTSPSLTSSLAILPTVLLCSSHTPLRTFALARLSDPTWLGPVK